MHYETCFVGGEFKKKFRSVIREEILGRDVSTFNELKFGTSLQNQQHIRKKKQKKQQKNNNVFVLRDCCLLYC